MVKLRYLILLGELLLVLLRDETYVTFPYGIHSKKIVAMSQLGLHHFLSMLEKKIPKI